MLFSVYFECISEVEFTYKLTLNNMLEMEMYLGLLIDCMTSLKHTCEKVKSGYFKYIY